MEITQTMLIIISGALSIRILMSWNLALASAVALLAMSLALISIISFDVSMALLGGLIMAVSTFLIMKREEKYFFHLLGYAAALSLAVVYLQIPLISEIGLLLLSILAAGQAHRLEALSYNKELNTTEYIKLISSNIAEGFMMVPLLILGAVRILLSRL